MIPAWIALIALIVFLAYAVVKLHADKAQPEQPKKEVPTLERRRRE
jgi:flagellar biogenesis protein FliO